MKGKYVEFWDTYEYHPKVNFPVFKHNLFSYELERCLRVLRKRYYFKYKFENLDKDNFLLRIKKLRG